MEKNKGIGQIYVREDRPASNSPDDLFAYCIRKAIEKDLISESMMHNQWASVLFG